MTDQKTLKQRIRARMAETGERYTQARAAIIFEQSVRNPAPASEEAQGVVLKVNKRSARIRVTGEDREITFRSGDVWKVVPGHVVELSIRKRWTYRGSAYASGRISSARTDIPALGLEPLPVEDWGLTDLAATYEPFHDPDPYAPEWRRLSAKPRPSIRFHPIAWAGRAAAESHDLDELTPCVAAEWMERGDREGAWELLMDILHEDLRCIDAHAHLGRWMFRQNPKLAIVHYEMGIRIGALSLPDDPELLVLWGPIYNRPYLRCLHGYGLCLWRLGQLDEAEAIFERVLQLNPPDNQGVRSCLGSVRRGVTWEAAMGEESARAY